MRRLGQHEKIKILFIAANPVPGKSLSRTIAELKEQPLFLDEELRAIRKKVLESTHREFFDFEYALAARPDDLLQYLHHYKPHVVHVGSHGRLTGEIVLLDDRNLQAKPVSPDGLKELFTVFKENIRLVFLNACHSKIQAQAIQSTIDGVIGMNTVISNEAAIIFAAAVYRALGEGCSFQKAVEVGRTALRLENIPEYTTPQLLHRAEIDPAKMYLIDLQELHNPTKTEMEQRKSKVQIHHAQGVIMGDYAHQVNNFGNSSKEDL
jgi:hypothetical protein